MVNIITKEHLPELMKVHFDKWLNFFTTKMNSASIVPLQWRGEDKNLRAFNSKSELIKWYGYHPVAPEPYRDFGFCIREFSMMSSFITPSVIVELGTNHGIGAFMLSRLNSQAKLYTVDDKEMQPAPENIVWETGHISKMNKVDCTYMINNSWDTKLSDKFNLCFIDADHGRESVLKDSIWAWNNKDEGHYAIMWHDYMEDCPGVITSVNEFSNLMGIEVYKLQDCTLAWTYGGQCV